MTSILIAGEARGADWRYGVGGSDVASILGLAGAYRNPHSLYLEKVEGIRNEVETEAMAMGKAAEPMLASLFTETTGLDVVGEQTWCRHPEHEWARATVDGFATDDPDGGLDAVLGVVEWKWYDWVAPFEDDALPAWLESQVQWQLAVTGLDRGWVGFLHSSKRYRVYEVARDDAVIADLLTICGEFWQRCLDRNPPPIDGSKTTSDAIRARWADADPGLVVDLDHLADTLDELHAVRFELKNLETEKRRLENVVMDALGPAEVGRIGGEVAVTWKKGVTRRLDVDAIKKAHPDLCAEFTTETATRRLLPKERK